jgi:hypothetical protein
MVAHSELIAAEVSHIKRFARVAQIKRAALSFAPIADEPFRECQRKKRPRAVLVIPARHARGCCRPACACGRDDGHSLLFQD